MEWENFYDYGSWVHLHDKRDDLVKELKKSVMTHILRSKEAALSKSED